MKILIAGASGMIGGPLLRKLRIDGNHVHQLVRREPLSEQEISWAPEEGVLDARRIEGFDAFIHLSGDNIAKGSWTAAKKRRIVDSRVIPTKLLADRIASLDTPPRVWLCASATGIYGSRGDEPLTETSASGTGFLADTCRRWEAAAEPAREKVSRLLSMRISAVLHPSGGALAKLIPIFKAGVGGPVGDGQQYMSWISLDDVIGAIEFLLASEQVTGPVNLCAPVPVTNRQLSKFLAHELHRPAIIRTPAFAARLAFGQMADETILASTRVLPEKLQHAGYSFIDSTLEAALHRMLS